MPVGPILNPKILVYLFGSLGDSIVAIPALRAVRRHFRDAEIVMLQNSDSSGLVLASQVIPDDLVDRYLSYDNSRKGPGKSIEFYRLWRQLSSERFDAAAYMVISERSEKAVLRDRSFFRLCGIRNLYGFYAVPHADLYPVDPSGRAANADNEAVFKLKRLAKDGIGSSAVDLNVPLIEPSPSDLDAVDSWLRERRQRPDVPIISIGPGCKQMVNDWPLENFAELGGRLLAAEPCEIVIVGGKAEFEMGERLLSSWGQGLNAAGVFSVRRSAALLSMCRFHIGLDTGTTHLAAAVGTRCFGIFGERNNPGTWYPLGDGHTIVHHPVPCGPCRSSICSVPGHPCMTGLTLESVWKHLKEFIDEHRDISSGITAVEI